MGVIGVALALLANALSPRGLSLTRNHFPAATSPPSRTNAIPPGSGIGPGATNPMRVEATAVAARLQARGLELASSNQVVQLFRDPRYDLELVVFVDARDLPQYEAGHIPGAYLLDPYRPEQGLATVLPACQTAEQIVIYCRGGDCEDSEFAAVILNDAGIPKSRLLVYGGGLAEWATNGLPIETGSRRSGQLRNRTR